MQLEADEICVRVPGERAPFPLGRVLLRQEPRTASRVIAGQAVVITIDENKLHVLNEVGSHIWSLCNGRNGAEVLDALVTEFEVSRSRAAVDLAHFVAELAALRALRVEPAEVALAPPAHEGGL